MSKKKNAENRDFLEAGIERYEEARDTIAAFEREMETLLEKAIHNRRNWKPLKDEKFKIKRASASPSTQFGYWIAIEITGISPRGDDAVLDCGMWWKNEAVDQPIVYASYYHKPKTVCNFPWDAEGSDICSFSRWQRTFLYLPLMKPDEIGGYLNRLLDALLKQLEKPS